LIDFFLGFLAPKNPKTSHLCNFPSVILEESLATQRLFLTVH